MNIGWIKLDINILNDTKIKLIRKFPDGDKLLVLWIGLLCLAMKSDMSGYIYITEGIPYSSDDLSAEFNIEKKTIEMGLALFKKYKMIDFTNGGVIEVINFNKHQELDKIEIAKENNRLRQERYRTKQKLLLTDGSNVTDTLRNDTDKIITDKEIDKKKKKEKEEECEDIFKKFWDLYPRKVGKTDAKEKFIINVKEKEYSDLLKAVENYRDYTIEDKTESKFIKHAKTFLHKKRWKDWIDYKNDKSQPIKKWEYDENE